MSDVAVPTSTRANRADAGMLADSPLARMFAAAACAVISYIHVKDQGGIGALKDPAYLGQGYRLLEVAALVAAALLLVQPRVWAWLLSAGVAAGPLVGFTLTRSVGLPSARDDIGNWTEPLGLWAIGTEFVLLVVSLVALARRASR